MTLTFKGFVSRLGEGGLLEDGKDLSVIFREPSVFFRFGVEFVRFKVLLNSDARFGALPCVKADAVSSRSC